MYQKICENFDLTGKITPVTAAMKLVLQNLVIKKLDCDDTIPGNLRAIWDSHSQMMNESKILKRHRDVIPDDAVDTNVDILDFGDARKDIACITIYARFNRQNGSYSCQLVFT